MKTKYVGISLLFVSGVIISFAASKPDVCGDSKTYYDYAKTMTSWSDYQKLMVKCSVEATKSDKTNPYSGFTASELDSLFNCVVTNTFNSLQTKCTYTQFISYEGYTSETYRKELIQQSPCALLAAQQIVAGQVYMQSCLQQLGLSKQSETNHQ